MSLSTPRQKPPRPRPRATWLTKIGATLRYLQTRSNGWKFGIKVSVLATFAVCVVNLLLTVFIVLHYEGENGKYLLYAGKCETVAKVNILVHLFISVRSTILLGSSSYYMQCLSAPTRSDLDAAHAKGQWLDVGILSPRNLANVSRMRIFLWCALGLSSVPIHLLYNSVVFTTITANTYWPIPVTKSFLASTNVSSSFVVGQNDSSVTKGVNAEAARLRQLWSDGQLEKLENLECINAYGTEYQVKGSVILVLDQNRNDLDVPKVLDDFSKTSPSRDGHWMWDSTFPCLCCMPDDWCPELGDIAPDRVVVARKLACLQRHSSTWSTQSGTVSYCLSERGSKVCQLQASLLIATIVIISNLLTVLVMSVLANRIELAPLLTIGDAIESYLERPDPYTSWMCLGWRKDFDSRGFYHPWKVSNVFKPKKRRRFEANSVNQLAVLMSLYMIINIGILYGMLSAKTVVDDVGGTLKDFGMGMISTSTMVNSGAAKTGVKGLLSNSLLANAGQLILTLIYYSYNRIFTIYSAATEWDSFAATRKALRVSGTPRGEQRSTYFLSLPYRIAIPLLVFSGLLHCLVSQSMFLVVIEYRHWDHESKAWTTKPFNTKDTIFGCAFSPLAIIFLLVAVGLMLCSLIVSGAFRLKTIMPVAGTCSAAIAAACHVQEGEDGQKSSISKIQWGVTGYGSDGIGHCAFSKSEVTNPEVDQLYE